MKTTDFTQALEKLIDTKLAAVDLLVKELIEPLEKVGNPEELIKKPYETWTPEDFALLAKIYGPGNDTPLAAMIFKKEYNKVLRLEQEEHGNALA